jgi:hypothetical protein
MNRTDTEDYEIMRRALRALLTRDDATLEELNKQWLAMHPGGLDIFDTMQTAVAKWREGQRDRPGG